MKVHFKGLGAQFHPPVQLKRGKVVSALMAAGKDLRSRESIRESSRINSPSARETCGGNTLRAIETDSDEYLLMDGGSGLRVFGQEIKEGLSTRLSIFLSHLHCDHIQGIPFSFFDRDRIIFMAARSTKMPSQPDEAPFPVEFETFGGDHFRKTRSGDLTGLRP